jgi:hypothetical protein
MADEARTPSGWTLIATLRHRPGRPTIVKLVQAGEPINTEAWSRSEGWCEHCRTRRARRTTYLLRNTDGRLAQVGSGCLADFTGQPTALRVLRPRVRRPVRRRPGVMRREPVEYIETRTYLAHVAQAILDSGFIPASAASRQRPATWVQAAAALDGGHAPSSRAQRRADETLDWVRDELVGCEQLDDFERRLALVLRQGRLTRRELPTAAAAVYAYHQHLRRQLMARKRTGEHIGRPGDSLTASFRVLRSERVSTPDGPVWRHYLRDELGRRAVWDSPDATLPARVQRLQVTVGRHTQARGRRPLTILSSCDAA